MKDKRNVGDIVTDKKGLKMVVVHGDTCDGCFYEETNCDPVRGVDDVVGCSTGDYVFKGCI